MRANPLCACGCGVQVKMPQNKYILGHAGIMRRKMTADSVTKAREMLKEGVSQSKVAAHFGVSQSTIHEIFWIMSNQELIAQVNALFPKRPHVIVTDNELTKQNIRRQLTKREEAKATLKRQILRKDGHRYGAMRKLESVIREAKRLVTKHG